MILVIDDCPRRIAAFRKAFGDRIHAAMSYKEAAPYLQGFVFGGYAAIYMDCDGVEGERLARMMARDRLHADARVVIHSSNYAGAIKMRDTLKDTHDVELADWRDVTA